MLHNDQPTDVDRLSRTRLAASLANLIVSDASRSGLAISVEGAWGSGKTSFMKLVREALNSTDHISLYTEFHPWLVGDRDALVSQLLKKIESAVSTDMRAVIRQKAAGITKALKPYAKSLKLAKLIPGSGIFHSMIDGVVDAVSSDDKKSPDLEQSKIKVVKALTDFAHPIVVFIDDLDRLTPSEFVEIVRAIKAVGDFPNVVYVLAFDVDYAISALRKAGIAKSAEYLDKIVQLRCTVPQASETDMRAIFDNCWLEFAKVNGITYADSFEITARIDEYWPGLSLALGTVRDIYRTFNRARLVAPLLIGEVDFVDLIVIETLAIKAPSVYSEIRPNGYMFCHGRLQAVSQRQQIKFLSDRSRDESSKDFNRMQELLDNRLQGVNGQVGKGAEKLIEALFPATASQHARRASEAEANEGRLRHPRILDVYLRCGIAGNDISNIAMQSYSRDPDSRQSWVDQFLRNRLLLRFVERLFGVDAADWADAEHAFVHLRDGIDTVSDEEANRYRATTFFEDLWRIIYRYDQATKSRSTPDRIRALIGNQKDLVVAAEAVGQMVREPWIVKGDTQSQPEADELASEIKKEFIAAAEASITSGAFFNRKRIGGVFRGLMHLDERRFAAFIADALADAGDRADSIVLAVSEVLIRVASRETFIIFTSERLDKMGGKDVWRSLAEKRLPLAESNTRLQYCYQSILGDCLVNLRTGQQTTPNRDH